MSSPLFSTSFPQHMNLDIKSAVEYINSKVLLSVVVGHYTRLHSNGGSGDAYKCICPFHNDTNPSLHINDAKRVYHCFSCKASGNIYKFVQEVEQIDYIDAVKKILTIQKKEGKLDTTFSISEFESIGFTSNPLDSNKEQIRNVLSKAVDYYSSRLIQDHRAGNARVYVKSRGISPRSIFEFQLGYAPESRVWEDSLIANLTGYNITLEEMKMAGLIISKSSDALNKYSIQFRLHREQKVKVDPTAEFGYDVYQRFRGRIMIPIRDHRGHVIGFGGRSLDNITISKYSKYPKYLNSPESIIFKKGSCLFAIDIAKKHIQSSNEAVIVEGYFDVIALHDCGIKNVVGSLGTALSFDQLDLAARFSKKKKVILLLDNDKAGLAAVKRVCSQILIPNKPDIDVYVATFANVLSIIDEEYGDSSIDKKKIVKDASDLLTLLNDENMVSTTVKKILFQAVGWKEWMLNNIITSYGFSEQELSNPLQRPDNLNLVVTASAEFISSFDLSTERTIMIYAVALKLSGRNENFRKRLEDDILKLVDSLVVARKHNYEYQREQEQDKRILLSISTIGTSNHKTSNNSSSSSIINLDNKDDVKVVGIDKNELNQNLDIYPDVLHMESFLDMNTSTTLKKVDSSSRQSLEHSPILNIPSQQQQQYSSSSFLNTDSSQSAKYQRNCEILLLSLYTHFPSLRRNIQEKIRYLYSEGGFLGWCLTEHAIVWKFLTICNDEIHQPRFFNNLKILEHSLLSVSSTNNGSLENNLLLVQQALSTVLRGDLVDSKTIDQLDETVEKAVNYLQDYIRYQENFVNHFKSK